MNRIYLSLIIVLGVLLAAGLGGTWIVGIIIWLFITGSVFGLLLHKQPVSHFIGRLLGLGIGSVIVCCLLRILLGHMHGVLGLSLGNPVVTLLLLLLMAASFFYVRHRMLGSAKHDAKELQTNERKPLLPPSGEGEDGTGDHHARH